MRYTDGLKKGGGSLKRFLLRMPAIISEAFFPGICCDCGQLFKMPNPGGTRHVPCDSDKTFKELMATHLCAACAERFRPVASPLCSQCGQPFVSPHGPDHVCGQCNEHPFQFDAARAAGLYEGGLRSAIHHLKYRGRVQLAAPLGRLMWQALVLYWNPDRFDRVVPVPLHPRRLRERGFNQAHLLVRRWPTMARQAGLHVSRNWIDTRLLMRHKATLPQTGLKKAQRATNLRHAFSILDNSGIRDERILLVDDVMTTGTTVDICARVLLGAGAAEVRVLTLARAVM